MLETLDKVVDKIIKRNKTQTISEDAVNFFLSLTREVTSVAMLLPRLFQGYKLENFNSRGKLRKIKAENNEKNIAIFLYHGYGMNENVNILGKNLAKRGFTVYSFTLPFLKSIEEQAKISAKLFKEAYKDARKERKKIALLGYSMGGLVAKYYLVNIKPKNIKIDYYISLSSPHLGTIAAYFGLGKSAREMEPLSDFVKELRQKEIQEDIKQFSLIPTYDFLVVPPESGFMNNKAINILFPRENHIHVVLSEKIADCIKEILTTEFEYFKGKAEYRKISPTLALRTIENLEKLITKISKNGLREKFNLITGYNNIKEEVEKNRYYVTTYQKLFS